MSVHEPCQWRWLSSHWLPWRVLSTASFRGLRLNSPRIFTQYASEGRQQGVPLCTVRGLSSEDRPASGHGAAMRQRGIVQEEEEGGGQEVIRDAKAQLRFNVDATQ